MKIIQIFTKIRQFSWQANLSATAVEDHKRVCPLRDAVSERNRVKREKRNGWGDYGRVSLWLQEGHVEVQILSHMCQYLFCQA